MSWATFRVGVRIMSLDQTPLFATPAVADSMMTSSNIRRLMERKYCQPEWALFHEVADATGMARRRADAIAVNLWESRGLGIHGFEIKVSRADWQREIRAPEKAETIIRNCDHWWIVAPKGVVWEGELPPTWGLYEVDGRGLTCRIKAPKLPNQHVDGVRPFLASLLRRADQQSGEELARKVREETAAIRARANEDAERQARERTRNYDGLKAQVDAFEKQAGIKISEYVGGDTLGKAVALVQLIGGEETFHRVTGLHNMIKDMGDRLGAALKDFRKES